MNGRLCYIGFPQVGAIDFRPFDFGLCNRSWRLFGETLMQTREFFLQLYEFFVIKILKPGQLRMCIFYSTQQLIEF